MRQVLLVVLSENSVEEAHGRSCANGEGFWRASPDRSNGHVLPDLPGLISAVDWRALGAYQAVCESGVEGIGVAVKARMRLTVRRSTPSV